MKQMIKNRALLIALALALLTILPRAISTAAVDIMGKASPELWQTSADGQTVDALILLQQDTSVATQTQTFTQAEQRAYIYQTLYQHAERSQQDLRTWLEQCRIDYRSFYVVNAIQAQLTEQDMLALVQRNDVKQIITNPVVHAALPETESLFTTQQTNVVSYGITTINADDVWAQGITGEGIVIAGQDTGYDWDHEALINNYRGWDGNTASHDYNWHDAIHSSTGSCGSDSPEPCDDHYHGTHTMGTMIGDENAVDTIGVAPNAQWIGCRNMNAGDGTPATYIECFEFFLAPYPVNGTPAQGDVSKAPHIINNSWSCPPSEGCDPEHTALLEQVVENVRAAGIMVVVSATNDGPNCGTITEPPAIFNASYSIAATNSVDQIASFSSRGLPGSMKPNLSAPGVSINSSLPGDAYGTLSGTSMSAPHVAAATALLWSMYPELIGDISQTETIFNTTALPVYSTQCGDAADAIPNSVFGYGRLDIYAAVSSNAGTITGTITSAGGTLLNGVTLTATPLNGFTRTITTSIQGTYNRLLPSDTYTLTASLPGYTSTSVTGITIEAGETITQDFTLAMPCQMAEGIDVTHAPTSPMHGQASVYTATVGAGDTPITYTWAFTNTVVEGNPITRTLLWDIDVPTYTLSITATNVCGNVTATKDIEVLAPQRVFLPVTLR